MIDQNLISLLKDTFKLDWNGIHGLKHWARVRNNGLKISQYNGANKRVVELFAFLHDVKRENEYKDIDHGSRSATFISELPTNLLGISDSEKEILCYACACHSDHKSIETDDITVLTCWDADALDLGRVGIYPNYKRLNTDIGKDTEFIKQAYARSIYSREIDDAGYIEKIMEEIN